MLPPGLPRLLALPGPDGSLDLSHLGDDNATLLERLRLHQLHDLVYFEGRMRPVEEIMMACCAAMGAPGFGSRMLPSPYAPSALALLDSWARIETAILSPALHMAPDASGSGFAVVTRRRVREGHVLVRLPSRLALTAEGAVRSMPQLLNAGLEAHVSIAAWLMRLVDAPPPELATYLKSLVSTAEVDCTLRWNDDELSALQTSLAHSRARKLQGWAAEQHRALFVERPSAWQHLRPRMNASYERFTWALCAVWSRSFHLRCAEPTCGDAAGASGGGWRVLAPGADMLNHAARGAANAMLMQPPSGVRPEQWRRSVYSREEESVKAGGERGGDERGSAADDATDGTVGHVAYGADGAAVATGGAAEGGGGAGQGGGGSGRRRERAKARATARASRPQIGAASASASSASAPDASDSIGSHPAAPQAKARLQRRGQSSRGALAAGLSDVALGGGHGVWLWREAESSDAYGGMDVGSQSWMQRVCLHAICLSEPDADTEAWDAVTAVPSTARDKSDDTVVLRATRDLDVGEEVLLDYGGRSNAELLTTHGFALEHNPHETVPITLAPRDEYADVKTKILAAGNLTAPFSLSPAALSEDSDLLVAMRVIAATPLELKKYADAFNGQTLSTRNEVKWRRLLRETVQALLVEAEAETTTEQDQALLRSLGQSSGDRETARNPSRRRRRAALVCRLGEKLLLRQVLVDLNDGLTRL